MNRLVVHHIYANGMACDLSGYRNHGVPYAVSSVAAPNAPGFAYDAGDSRVIVEPSQSLQDLIAVRAVVTFYLNPPGGLNRRYNLIEGHLCRLHCSLIRMDRFPAPSSMHLDFGLERRAHPISFLREDGIRLNFATMESTKPHSYWTALPLPPHTQLLVQFAEAGPHGIAIGHWPETSGQYTFSGFIREAWVYKYDPAVAAKDLLDPCCCQYRKALDETAQTMRDMGYTAEKARAQGMDLIKFGLSISARVRGTDQSRSQQHATLSAMALAAFKNGDSSAYTNALTQLAKMAATTLSLADLEQIHAQEEQLLKALPLPVKQWQALIGKMCWGRAKLGSDCSFERSKEGTGQITTVPRKREEGELKCRI